MLSVKVHTNLCNPKQAARLSRAVAPLLHNSTLGYSTGIHVGLVAPVQHNGGSRAFSTTPVTNFKDFFPAKETENIRRTPAAWPHHGYTEEEMLNVVPAHRPAKTWGDWAAWKFMRSCRWGMDFFTGMKKNQKVDKANPTTAVDTIQPLTESQWLLRFLFLESIAGVPGMVAGMLRHLHSIRRLKRDNGWIETLLEESYNERMHLLTFIKMCEPGWFMKFLLLGAQGVYFNGLFITYLISPKITHRFVGYLEEEAVHTYTLAIKQIEDGHLPKWSDPNFVVPDIAVKYWHMPEGKRTMKDLILYIRADEAGHRGVNHTLANLNQNDDPNPFVSEYKGSRSPPRPTLKAEGFEREEVL
ncbi:Alternative oxidase, mitochondrial [Daldinia childiae]|uniref:Alternative oxidase, mitochondrial n=1 Tax=Daldinia childiae TaxID=326645 RepID=UPI0014450D4C|nr:Alternative oxidase, mitochondrial [Daldinia childiae]KAF3062037.1 Alternative oxidase, mitochondrial [Daldinia childiae]